MQSSLARSKENETCLVYFKKENINCSKKQIVRPVAAGLLIGIEYSRVRDSSCMYLTSFVTTRIGVELVAVQRM